MSTHKTLWLIIAGCLILCASAGCTNPMTDDGDGPQEWSVGRGTDLFTDERHVTGVLMGQRYGGSPGLADDSVLLTIGCSSDDGASTKLSYFHPRTTEFAVSGDVSVMIRFGNQQTSVETWGRLPIPEVDFLTSQQPESFIKRLAEDNSSLAMRGLGSDGSAWTFTFDISESKAVAQEVLEECNVDATVIN